LSAEVVDRVRRRLAESGTPPSRARVAELVRSEAGAFAGDTEVLELIQFAESEFVGTGPLEPLLRDMATTDVLVNGADEVWVDRGDGLVRAAVRFPDDAAVRRLGERLAATVGRRLDEASPWVDAILPGGSRMHAVLPSVAGGRTCLSLRTFRPRGFTLDQLVETGTLSMPMSRLVKAVVQARLAYLVTGGTGSGKTTMLGTLLGLLGPGERLILVEDSAELRPSHDHVVCLTARPPNIEGVGEITLRDLVRQALRMRPDRLVVGEVRGAEVVELLSALNTGHEGGAGTVHANSPAELPARLEALGALGGLSRTALHSQLAAAVQVAFHLERRGGQRVLAEVGLLGRSGDLVDVTRAWGYETGPGPGWAGLDALLRARGCGDAL